MKKRFVLFLIVACIALLVSCGTTSEAAIEVVEPIPSEPAVDLTEVRARAAAARENALSIKADVAVKNDFDNAVRIFDTAETAADPVAAFLDAERLFTEAYNQAKTLRDAAMAELEKANNEIRTAEDEAARALEEAAQGAM
jgi:hypothetical protein